MYRVSQKVTDLIRAGAKNLAQTNRKYFPLILASKHEKDKFFVEIGAMRVDISILKV